MVKRMRQLASITILALCCLLPGCNEDDQPSLDRFQQQWHQAVNSRQPHKLYPMMNAASRRQIELTLEQLRGLEPEHHTFIINQLGGERIKSLHELTPDKYFGLWWRRITDEQLPTMRIEATGDTAAYMLLTLNDKSQRIELMIEAGRWRWVLPKQHFPPPKINHPKSNR